jgi:glycosyltransferase involved in cell wall biosynthesis
MIRAKILHCIDGFRIGGAEVNLLEQIKQLAVKGYDQTVCSFDDVGALKESYQKLGIPVYIIQRKHRFDPIVLTKLYQLIQHGKFSIIQTVLFYPDVVGMLTGAAAGVKVRISVETASHYNVFFSPPYRRLMYRTAMKYVSRIIAVSGEVKNSIIQRERIHSSRIAVIPNAVDFRLYDPVSNGSNRKKKELHLQNAFPVLGTVARLTHVKGHGVLIRAAVDLVKKYPALHCLFIGDGELRSDLEKQINEMGLGDHFSFLGFRKDIPELLYALDIFVLPSLTEGMPNVILEAMACSVPVVATEVGGIPEVIRDGWNGILIPPEDPKKLAGAILKLLEDRSFRSQIGENGRKHVQDQYSLDRQIQCFQKTYEECGS